MRHILSVSGGDEINYSIPTVTGVTSVFTIKRYHYHLLSPAFNGAITGPSVLLSVTRSDHQQSIQQSSMPCYMILRMLAWLDISNVSLQCL